MNECVCAITGHRPSRFKLKYSEDYALCKKIKANMLEVFRKLHDEKEVRRFYVSGALGVDMWAAEQIFRLKEQPGYEDCCENYVKRNCYMVDQANYLVAVYDDVWNLRSGTMQCVRYARKNDVPVVLIPPDTANIAYPM